MIFLLYIHSFQFLIPPLILMRLRRSYCLYDCLVCYLVYPFLESLLGFASLFKTALLSFLTVSLECNFTYIHTYRYTYPVIQPGRNV